MFTCPLKWMGILSGEVPIRDSLRKKPFYFDQARPDDTGPVAIVDSLLQLLPSWCSASYTTRLIIGMMAHNFVGLGLGLPSL